MALFSERSLKCARKMLDTADIVREAMFRHLTHSSYHGVTRTWLLALVPGLGRKMSVGIATE
jgi:hypothetical protein